MLNQSGVRMLVAARSFKTSDYAAMIAEVRAGLPRARARRPDRQRASGRRCPTAAATPAVLADRAGGGSTRMMRSTSSTPRAPPGTPRAPRLSHHNILNNAHIIGEVCRYTEADRICVPVPLFHTFGMVIGNLGATTRGACLVYPAPSFEPRATLAAVAAGALHVAATGVPAMFIAELAVLDESAPATYDLSSLRTGMMAGSPCPVEVMKQVVDRMGMTEVTIGYGMTETSPISTQTRADDSLDRRVSTVGRVHPHVEIKIVDPETGDDGAARGARGVLHPRLLGDARLLGPAGQDRRGHRRRGLDAHRRPGRPWTPTATSTSPGRIKDMLIRGGENVYPREIEEFLFTHPDVLDVQVIGVPDARYGEEIMAWIRLRPGAAELTVDDVRAFATGRLAHYKIPRYVRIVEEFPMTVSGKVRKVEMRRASIELLGLRDAAATRHA